MAYQYKKLAKQFIEACTVNGEVQQGLLDDAFETVPKYLGIELTLAQYERLEKAVTEVLEERAKTEEL